MGTQGQTVNIYDSNGNPITESNNGLKVALYDSSGNAISTTSGTINVRTYDSSGTSITANQANQYLYNPSSGLYEAQRTPTKFISLAGVAIVGATAVWTPATGKKFRFLGMTVSNTSGAAATMGIQDDATAFAQLYLLATGAPITFQYPGNGYLSSAANNPLKFNGNFTIWGAIWGCEE